MLEFKPLRSFSVLLLWGAILLCTPARSQASEIFTLEDFDLRGPVQSCVVITDYGKEEYNFNRQGQLVKALTRFSEQDYDVTYYKYQDSIVKEQRDEVYREGTFDSRTSIAHFFSRDTTNGIRITERIFSYDKEFQEQHEYIYDADGRVLKVVSSDQEGVDQTDIRYEKGKKGQTAVYMLNDNLLKTIRTYRRPSAQGDTVKVRFTKEFQDSIPSKALEEVYSLSDQKLSETEMAFRKSDSTLYPLKKTFYEYGEKGLLSAIRTQKNGLVEKKSFIYQFDGTKNGNWIKEIVIPANAYTTRKIYYFKEPSSLVEKK